MKLHPKAPPQVRRVGARWEPRTWVDLKDIAEEYQTNPPLSVAAEGRFIDVTRQETYGPKVERYEASDETEAAEFAAILADPLLREMWMMGAYNPRE